MTQLLGRKYKLTFGKPGREAKVVTGLDISFDIERTTEAKPNTGTINVFNLSRENRAALEDSEAQVILEAGYEGQMGIIFTGNDLIVQTIKRGVDYETVIRARDGGKELTETQVTIDVPEGEAFDDTVKNVLKQYTKITGRKVDLSKLPKTAAARNKIISKQAAVVLSELLDPEGYEWSIQNGEFRVVPVTQGSDETVYILGPSSGLISSPEKTRLRLPHAQEDTDGISFTCLMNSQVTPLRRVQLAASSIKGIYKVTRVTYRGDLKGQDWYCNAEGVPL